MSESIKQPEAFVVRHYGDDERPCIKGNGFDGLTIGEDREEAEQFVAWVNARLAVEQNTAELLRELTTLQRWYADVSMRAEKAEAEVERLRAELARLTTLRPHACDDEYDGEKLFWGKDGDSWICDPLFVHSTHWTPLPKVKEPK